MSQIGEANIGEAERKQPLIGIICSEEAEYAPHFGSRVQKKAKLNSTYLRAVEQNGGIPLLIPFCEPETAEALATLCQGFLLPGGEDIDPVQYGQPLRPECGRIRPELDAFCRRICDHAQRSGKPLLGICKGMQFLNIYFGGTLYQDLSCREEKSYLHQQEYDRTYPVHAVSLAEGSGLREILGEASVRTNTMHHQAVDRVGEGLTVSAVAEDGIIEGIESRDARIIGVQWHPEELTETVPEMNRLFQHLVNLAGKSA